jgi:hypothetical protein
MNHEGSDIDIFECVVTPIEKVLRGQYSNKSKFIVVTEGYEEIKVSDITQPISSLARFLGLYRTIGVFKYVDIIGTKVEKHVHNAQKVTQELINMNLNFFIL